MDGVGVFVISLDSGGARFRGCAASLERAGLAFRHIPAVDGRRTPPEALALYDGRQARGRYGRALTGGEVGCWLSHRRALEAFLDSDMPLGLVLEDDALLPAARAGLLGTLVAHLSGPEAPRWEVANLMNRAKKFYTALRDFEAGDGQRFTLCRAHYFPISGAALLWTRAGAGTLLAARPAIFEPYDAAVRDLAIRRDSGLALRPVRLFQPLRADSEIDTGAPRGALVGGARYWAVHQTWRMRHRALALANKLAANARPLSFS